MSKLSRFSPVGSVLALAVLVGACGDDGNDSSATGTLRVQLEAEETITEGLTTGTGSEQTRDYGVTYSKYLVAVGNVEVGRTSPSKTLRDEASYIADLTQVGSQGVALVSFEKVSTGQWSSFAYETVLPDANTKGLGNVAAGDVQQMIDNGWTYWIEGTVERAAADGGPVEFVLQTDVPTLFDHCGLDGQPGVAVTQSGATATITLHGDHIFFNSFPTGSEGTVQRRAAWIIQADTDGDGKVSSEDLAALDATEVFTSALGYSLDGAPTLEDGTPLPIESALDFVRAQLATQGHFKGEGECIWHFEGAEGEHDHEGHEH